MAETPDAIKAKLDEANARERGLVARAVNVLGRVLYLQSAVERGGANRLDVSARDIESAAIKAAGPFWLSWNHVLWNAYQPGEDRLLDHVRIAGRRDKKPLNGESVVPDMAELAPLLAAQGALIFLCDAHSQNKARQALQSVVMRIALAMPSQARFTLLDPIGLGAAFPFRYALGNVRPSGRSAYDELSDVTEDIRRINEQVLGHVPRFADLNQDQRAGEVFEFVVAADFPQAYAQDARAASLLQRVANSGPRAGRYVLLEVNTSEALPHGFSLDQFERATLIDLRSGELIVDKLPDAGRQKTLLEMAAQAGKKRRGGDWDRLIRPTQYFCQTSETRVETPLGERLRFWLDGEQNAHALLAGQPGSGKSFFLHVLITGLAARYAPDELRFVLIDGKGGVEFDAYRALPHAQVVCLRTAPAMAQAVLADFRDEMDARYDMFRAAGTSNLSAFRQKTGQIVPRMVLIADEYQQFFESDVDEVAANHLKALLEKGRAAGTHVVLASQQFLVRGFPYGEERNVHIRAALPLSPEYVQSLDLFRAEGKRLIQELSASGQVVLNTDSGRDGANARGSVARFEQEVQSDAIRAIVADIGRAAGASKRPVLLNGADYAVVSENPFIQTWRVGAPEPGELEAWARRSKRNGGFGIETWSAGDHPLPLWVGRLFDVAGHALCPLRRAPNQNLLVLGTRTEVRNRMLASAIAALGAMLRSDAWELILIDGLRPTLPGAGLLALAAEHVRDLGVPVTIVPADAGENDIAEVLQGLEKQTETTEQPSRSVLVVLSEPDRMYALHSAADRFSTPTSGPAASLRRILTRGPQAGVHLVVTASGMAAFHTTFVARREERYFSHRVVQQMSEQDSLALFDATLASRIGEASEHPNCMLMLDQMLGNRSGVLVNAYAVNIEPEADQSLAAFAERLAALSRSEADRVS
jgi:DNA segregation ATPase FtsK/SpoIIIE, S-DNA-T family